MVIYAAVGGVIALILVAVRATPYFLSSFYLVTYIVPQATHMLSINPLRHYCVMYSISSRNEGQPGYVERLMCLPF
jgi:hypothetical protein